jgi:hypothetical protein
MVKKRLFVDMDGTLCIFKPTRTLETLYAPGYFRDLPPQKPVVDAVKQIIRDHSDEVEVYVLTSYLSGSTYAAKEKMEWLDEYLPEIDDAHRVFIPCGTDKSDITHWRRAGYYAARNSGKKNDMNTEWGFKSTRESLFKDDKASIGIALQSFSQDDRPIAEDDFLLDDYTKNLIDWEPPGRGIKLLNGINHSRGTWQGSTTYKGCTPDDITNDIMSVARGEPVKYPAVRYIRQKEEIEQAAQLHEQRTEYIKNRMADILSVYNVKDAEVEAFKRQPAVTTVMKALYSLNLTISDIRFYLTENGHSKDTGWYKAPTQKNAEQTVNITSAHEYKHYLEARTLAKFIFSRNTVTHLQILGSSIMSFALEDVLDKKLSDIRQVTAELNQIIAEPVNETLMTNALSRADKKVLAQLRTFLEDRYAMPTRNDAAPERKPAEYRKAPRRDDDEQGEEDVSHDDEFER